MATERLIIEIDERGSRVVKRNIDNVAKSSRGAEGAVTLLRRTLGLIGGALLISQIAGIADEFTNLQNRLRVVTNSQRELNAVTNELLGITTRTRSSLNTNAELFNRLTLSTRELGLSQQDVLDLTESLNQAVTLSGASAIEAQAGLIQLSQGLASGALRGDELRSVLEQLPIVADVIAKQLGVTRGQLRDLGKEGRITADVIVEGFRSASAQLAGDFGKTIPTLGQSFTVLRSNITLFIGRLDESIGASRTFSKLILDSAMNVDLLAKGVAIAGTLLATVLVRQGIVVAIQALRGLTLALLANPFTAFAAGITLVISSLVAFGDEIRLSQDSTATLRDFFVAAFEQIGSVLNTVLTRANALFASVLNQADQTFDTVNGNVGLFITNIARAVDRTVDNFLVGLTTIRTAWEFLPQLLGDIGIRAANSLIAGLERGVNQAIGLINRIGSLAGIELDETNLGRLENQFAGAGDRFGIALFNKLQERTPFTLLQDQATQLLNRADEIARANAQTQGVGAVDLSQRGATGPDPVLENRARAIEEVLQKLRDEADLLKLGNREREIQSQLLKIEEQLRTSLKDKTFELVGAQRELIETQLRENQALQDRAILLNDIIGPQEEANRQIQALNGLLLEGAISVDQFNEKFNELRLQQLEGDNSIGAVFERSLIRFQSSAGTVAEGFEQSFTNAFNQASNALTNFLETGKFEINDFFRNIASQLLRQGSQQLIGAATGQISSGVGGLLQSLSSGGAGGGFGGLISSFAGSLFGAQNGADFRVSSATSAATLGGGVDNRLVAFRANDRERVTVTPEGQTRRPVQVNFNITTPDADSFRRSEGNIAAKTLGFLQRGDRENN